MTIAIAIAIYDFERPLYKPIIARQWYTWKVFGKLTVIGDIENWAFSARLNLHLSVISLRFGSSLFQAAGPATEKALSSKPVLVLGTSKEQDVEYLRIARSCSDNIWTRTSVTKWLHSGLRRLTNEWTMRHSLYCTLKPTGNQCSSRIAGHAHPVTPLSAQRHSSLASWVW